MSNKTNTNNSNNNGLELFFGGVAKCYTIITNSKQKNIQDKLNKMNINNINDPNNLNLENLELNPNKIQGKSIKKGKIEYRKSLEYFGDNEKLEVNLSYELFKTSLNKCERCLLYNCEEEEEICSICEDTIKNFKKL